MNLEVRRVKCETGSALRFKLLTSLFKLPNAFRVETLPRIRQTSGRPKVGSALEPTMVISRSCFQAGLAPAALAFIFPSGRRLALRPSG